MAACTNPVTTHFYMDNERLLNLLENYRAGICSPEELEELEQWYTRLAAGDATYLSEETGSAKAQLADELLTQFRRRVSEQQAPVRTLSRTRRILYRITAAAAILLVLGTSSWYFFIRKPATGETIVKETPVNNNIQPGGDKARLTLADGTTIELTDAANGTLAQQGISQVEKTKDGLLVYKVADGTQQNATGNQAVLNTISTPRGGQYQVVLTDGSRVWLNASSSLKFPATFPGKERRVELTGEAYFEVAKGNRPFIVKVTTGKGEAGEVEVLGTHFNINAYTDEASIKTTLLEGKVKVSASQSQTILQPGQQAQVVNSNVSVINNADTEEAVAWKNGLFTYTNADIQTIMRQAARWYDIDVVYEGSITTERFRGKIARNANLDEFLKILELNNVQFTIEGKKVKVKYSIHIL